MNKIGIRVGKLETNEKRIRNKTQKWKQNTSVKQGKIIRGKIIVSAH